MQEPNRLTRFRNRLRQRRVARLSRRGWLKGLGAVHGHWIGGGGVASAEGRHFKSYNPANGRVIRRIAEADKSEVERAVAAAERGHAEWAPMTGAERGRVLQRMAAVMREHRDELAALKALDGGKPIAETPEADVDSGADCLEYFAGQASFLQGEYQALDGGSSIPAPKRSACAVASAP